MDDDFDVDVQDLAIDEIRELLEEAGAQLTDQQVEQLARLVAEAGSIEAALEALSQIAMGDRAAA